jgi:hypothetical protein
MEKFQHKILTKRTTNIFLKIEHLIHLTQKRKKKIELFFCVFKLFCVHDKKS